MALTLFWTGVFFVAAVIASFYNDRKSSNSITPLLLSCSFSIVAVTLSWFYTIVPIFNFIDRILPDRGTDVHDITAYVFTLPVILGAYMIAPMLPGAYYERVARYKAHKAARSAMLGAITLAKGANS